MFDTVASQVSALSFVDIFNFCVFLTFTICYTYQLFYVLVVLTRRAPKKVARANHRYAVMVAARNEETVIADLIHSIKVQNYPAELIDIFVIADNCTDNTADVAREAGAIVFPRSNDKLVGKGYALDYGLKAIWEQYADRDYEAFFVFDADNVLDVNYFREMNATFDNGAKASTSYRNSKNFGEQLDLRRLRRVVPARGAVSEPGAPHTGHLLRTCRARASSSPPSHPEGRRRLAVAPAHRGHRVLRRFHHRRRAHLGYCPTAVLYDEQPITFRESWNQRFRWAKGFYQVFAHYAGGLVKGTLTNPAGYRFACYDMLMTIAPGMLLSIISILFNTIIIVLAATGVMSTRRGHRELGDLGRVLPVQLRRVHVRLRRAHHLRGMGLHPHHHGEEDPLHVHLPLLHAHLHPHRAHCAREEGGVEAHPPFHLGGRRRVLRGRGRSSLLEITPFIF